MHFEQELFGVLGFGDDCYITFTHYSSFYILSNTYIRFGYNEQYFHSH